MASRRQLQQVCVGAVCTLNLTLERVTSMDASSDDLLENWDLEEIPALRELSWENENIPWKWEHASITPESLE